MASSEVVYEEKECCVCKESLNKLDTTVLPCGHRCIHLSCLLESRLMTCPLCRVKIEHNKENRVIKFLATDFPYDTTFGEVMRRNPDFVNWLLGLGNPNDMVAFRNWIQEKKIIKVGKHYGRTYGDVMRGDPQYCDWVLSLKDAGGEILEFQRWIIGYRRINMIT
jgi:hypothetical protein